MKLAFLHRWIAGFLDLFTYFIIIVFPVGILDALIEIDLIDYITGLLFYVFHGLYLAKDVFGNSTLFKKYYGIKIVNNSTGEEVKPVKTVFRNSTLILLFPIEYFIAFFSPKRRIGDLIFNTRLVSTSRKNSKSSWAEIVKTKLNSEIIMALLIAQAIGYSSLLLIRKFIDLL